jgi:hypothetical protein
VKGSDPGERAHANDDRGHLGCLDDSAELIEAFGLWEQIFCGEFDGRRRKRVLVKIIGE